MILLWQTANMSDDKCVKYVVVEETHVAKNAYDDELRLFIHLLFKPDQFVLIIQFFKLNGCQNLFFSHQVQRGNFFFFTGSGLIYVFLPRW